MLFRNALRLALALLLLPALSAMAAEHQHDAMNMQMASPAMSQTFPLQGEVVKLEDGKVVLAHEAIAALNWPAMTMPFQLATPALAKGLKPGLKIEARFEKVEGDAPRIVSWQAKP